MQKTIFNLETSELIKVEMTEQEIAAHLASAPQPLPNWEALRDRALAGDLYPIFERLTVASLASDANAISTARGDIINAILSVKHEAALASGLALLINIGGYTFTTEEKELWNTVTESLHFSQLVRLP